MCHETACHTLWPLSAGGSVAVPAKDVRRRFRRGLDNFPIYRALADAWAVYDNSRRFPSRGIIRWEHGDWAGGPRWL